jgi:hypothetical protein
LYKDGMGRLPENALEERRSPVEALVDLIDKFNGVAANHPDLPKLARMIAALFDHIADRREARIAYLRPDTAGRGFGLY